MISGGQTGAGQAVLRAARSAGIATGGTAAKGWVTEDGPAAWLVGFGLVTSERPGYPARTRVNVLDSELDPWLASEAPVAPDPGPPLA